MGMEKNKIKQMLWKKTGKINKWLVWGCPRPVCLLTYPATCTHSAHALITHDQSFPQG
jgi:hypothetical protein